MLLRMHLFLLSLDQGRSRSPVQLCGGQALPGKRWNVLAVLGTGAWAGLGALRLCWPPLPSSYQVLSPAACHLKVRPPWRACPGPSNLSRGKAGVAVCHVSWALGAGCTCWPRRCTGAQAKTQVCTQSVSAGTRPRGWPALPHVLLKDCRGPRRGCKHPTWGHLPWNCWAGPEGTGLPRNEQHPGVLDPGGLWLGLGFGGICCRLRVKGPCFHRQHCTSQTAPETDGTRAGSGHAWDTWGQVESDWV